MDQRLTLNGSVGGTQSNYHAWIKNWHAKLHVGNIIKLRVKIHEWAPMGENGENIYAFLIICWVIFMEICLNHVFKSSGELF